MDEIIARNMLSWLKLLIKLLVLHLVGCLYYCISDARSHKHQIYKQFNTTDTITSLPQIVLQNFRSQIALIAVLMNVTSNIHRFLLCYSPLLKDVMLQAHIISELFDIQNFRPLQWSILVLHRWYSCSWQENLKTLWTAVTRNSIIGTSKNNPLYVLFIIITTTCFGHCGPSSGHKKCMMRKTIQIMIISRGVYSNLLTRSRRLVFPYWSNSPIWKIGHKDSCVLTYLPLPNCIKHNGDDAPKERHHIYSHFP